MILFFEVQKLDMRIVIIKHLANRQGRAEGGFQGFQETPFGFYQVLRKLFNK